MNAQEISRRQLLCDTAVTAALSLGTSVALGQSPTGNGLMAGSAETTITPTPVGTVLIGPMRESTGVHDDLFARVLVISDGKKRVAIVTIDFLGLDFCFSDQILAEIERQTGIPRTRIMINCSHTHSAPLTIPWRKWEKKLDKPWHKTMPGKIAAAVSQAAGTLQKAILRYGREPIQIGFNRRLPTETGVIMRPNPHGAVVPWVDVLCVEAADGKPIAILVSHAAHPVIVHGASTLITADYPGFAIAAMRKNMGSDGVFMFAQACGGNINGFPLRGGIRAADAAGKDLGSAAERAVRKKGPAIKGNKLLDISSELSLPLQQPPSAQECEKLLAKDPQNDFKRELLEIARSKKQPNMKFAMRAFAVADELCILGLSHEVFAEYQLLVDKISPFKHNMVFAYTNGCEGYVGTRKDYELGDRGGYETAPLGAPLLYHGRLAPRPAAEAQIREGITRLLQGLKG